VRPLFFFCRVVGGLVARLVWCSFEMARLKRSLRMVKPFPNMVVSPRPEPDLAGRWGLRDTGRDRWLDVVFSSQRDAEDALRALQSLPDNI
jgi:hypothetical protein